MGRAKKKKGQGRGRRGGGCGGEGLDPKKRQKTANSEGV